WLAMDRHERETACGTYHLTASLRCSWFGFASAIMREAQRAGLLARIPEVMPIASIDYPTRAQRPAFSVLDNTRLALVFGQHLPPWASGMREVIGELAALQDHGVRAWSFRCPSPAEPAPVSARYRAAPIQSLSCAWRMAAR